MPKDITGYALSAVDRRRCASILRLLLDAQTVQNLSLKGIPEVGGVVELVNAESALPSNVTLGVWTGVLSAAGGGGGGGGAAVG